MRRANTKQSSIIGLLALARKGLPLSRFNEWKLSAVLRATAIEVS
jgi:hypothetical protein